MLVFLGGVAKIYPNLSDGAKKYQLTFLVLLLGMDSISKLGSDTKKCQQAFLAPLLEMDLKLHIRETMLRQVHGGPELRLPQAEDTRTVRRDYGVGKLP